MTYCRRHSRYQCDFPFCRAEAAPRGASTTAGNLGSLALDVSSGDLAIGIGGGLAIDTANGDLAVELGGIAFDL